MTQSKSKFVWIARVYTQEHEKVVGRVKNALELIEKIRLVTDDPIVFLVPKKKDCGYTAVVLAGRIKEAGLKNIHVLPALGDPNTDVLNIGLRRAHDLGGKYAVTISNKARGSVTEMVYEEMQAIFSDPKNKVVGVAADSEHNASIQNGMVLNTFAAWHINSLIGVGGFSLQAEAGGVEEVAPLVHLVRKWGECVSIIIPPTSEVKIHDTPQAWADRERSVASKQARQDEVLDKLGGRRVQLEKAVRMVADFSCLH